MDDLENGRKSTAETLALWREWINTSEGKSQEKLHAALQDLRNDPGINTSALCRDFLELMIDLSPFAGEKLSDLVEPLEPHFKRVRAKRNAATGHIKNNQARDFVVREWTKNRQNYKNNKSDFARHYVRLVLNEFSVTVTEKQLREVWLKDTPAASKPAG